MLTYEDTLKIANKYFKGVFPAFVCETVDEVNKGKVNDINYDADFIAKTYPIPKKECETYLNRLLENPCVTYYEEKYSGKNINRNPNAIFLSNTYKDERLYDCYIIIYKFSEVESTFNVNDVKPIIEKIEKLLRVTEDNGATESEAIAASLKAQRLMAKYHIDNLEGLDKQKDEPIVRSVAYTKQGNNWKTFLGVTVAKNYRCECLVSGNNRAIVFIGYHTDATIARKIFSFLYNACLENGRSYVAEQKIMGYNTHLMLNTYCTAFCEGVKSELDKQCTALAIVVPSEIENMSFEITAYNEDNKIKFNNRKVNVIDDYLAAERGYNEGRNTVRGQRLHTSKNAIEG